MNDGYLEILNSIASSSPTPGGGSVAALSLAHAHSLAIMVSRLTIKSDKWIDGHEVANRIISHSDNRITDSISLADKDALAFDEVMAAYRLPKDEGSINTRSEAIRNATIEAALAPLETIKSSLVLLMDLKELSHACNANALTDLAAAAELAHSAAKIAEFNVKINLDYLNGDDVDSINNETHNTIRDCENTMLDISTTYTNRLGW